MSYELRLTNDSGDPLYILDDVIHFHWNRVINGVGRCSLTLPGSYDYASFKRDYRIELWRSPTPGSNKKLESIYLIRRPTGETLMGGLTQFVVHGVDFNELLERRIVAYNAGSSESDKTDFIDDMMKAIVRENLGALSAADRDYSANGFSVQVDVSLGPSITKAFSRRNVLEILQDLSEIARTNGTEVYFQVVPTSTTTFEFQTFIGQPGVDRRYPGGESPIVFSLERSSLSQPRLEDDYEFEENYIYAGGQGQGAGRVIQTAQDDAQINQSIWNRREAFRDARNEETVAGVLAEAEARLASSRPKRRFYTTLLSVENACYGIDWNWGDRITVEYLDQRLDALIRIVNVDVDIDGKEIVEGRVEVEDVA